LNRDDFVIILSDANLIVVMTVNFAIVEDDIVEHSGFYESPRLFVTDGGSKS